MAKNALQISDRLAAVAAAESLPFRQAPHNLEAEQALLGAILVNNEAMDRVSSFLDPHHFYDPLHQQIYETAGKLIHVGKQATPITLRTFFETAEPISPTLTVPQYLGTLAAQATTIINAEDYGRTVFDLATRRALIIIGEDMVNGAYDSTVDATPQLQIEEAETRLYDLAEQRKYGQGFLGFGTALTNAIEMASAAYQRSGHLSGLSTGLTDLDNKLGGLQSSDLIILAGRPSMGKTALATNIAFHIAKSYRAEPQADGTIKPVDGAVVGFFSLEMSAEQLATRILSEQAEIGSEKIRRGMINENEFRKLVEASRADERKPALHRPDGRHLDRAARRTRPQAEAAEGPRCAGRRLPAAPHRLLQTQRQPRAGDHRDHHRPQGTGQGARGSDHRAVAAVASGRAARGQAPAAFRPAENPVPSSRTPTSSCSSTARNTTSSG